MNTVNLKATCSLAPGGAVELIGDLRCRYCACKPNFECFHPPEIHVVYSFSFHCFVYTKRKEAGLLFAAIFYYIETISVSKTY